MFPIILIFGPELPSTVKIKYLLYFDKGEPDSWIKTTGINAKMKEENARGRLVGQKENIQSGLAQM